VLSVADLSAYFSFLAFLRFPCGTRNRGGPNRTGAPGPRITLHGRVDDIPFEPGILFPFPVSLDLVSLFSFPIVFSLV